MGQQNWRTEVDAGDYFGHQKKQLEVADRRPVIRKASDLVGPGIAPTAVRVTDFNNLLATYNGFFSSSRSANGPVPEVGGADDGFDINPYVGTVSSDAELGGVQTFTNLDTEVTYRRVFRRNPADAATLYWGVWTVV